MTIEANLASIAKSLELIAAYITADKQPVHTTVTVPNVQPAPTPIAPVAVTPVTFTAVAAPAVAATVSPSEPVFATHAAFVEFVMNSYKTLGPIKGAKIQEVLTTVGVKNINDVKPEMYAQIKSGIEALLA